MMEGLKAEMKDMLSVQQTDLCLAAQLALMRGFVTVEMSVDCSVVGMGKYWAAMSVV